MNEKNRRTGRTTRLINEAIKYAKNGRAVYIMAADDRHLRELQKMAGNEAFELGIKIETPETLSNFDWRTMSLKNAHPNCLVLVDHFAIEKNFERMFEMLHRFDE